MNAIRWIRLWLMAALILAGSRASALVVMLPPDPGSPVIPLIRQDVQATVHGPTARTVWKGTFLHTGHGVREATFLFTLPDNAQLRDFVVRLDGEELVGEVLPKDEARRIYEGIVRRMRDPGLLEFVDRHTVRVRIFPLNPGKEGEVEIEYLETLARREGLYEYAYDQSTIGNVAIPTQLSISLETAEPLSIVQSPTHPVKTEMAADRKSATVRLESGSALSGRFALLYALGGGDLGVHLIPHRLAGAKEGSFLLMLSPPEKGAMAQRLAKDVVFVFDVSGSMAGEEKIGKAKAALVQALEVLEPGDRFALITFSTGIQKFRDTLAPADDATRAEAAAWINALRARGGTNIHGALSTAREMVDAANSDRLTQIVFFTDGQPTVGATDTIQILDAMHGGAARKDSQPRRVFSLGFGTDVNVVLLDQLAERSGTFSTYLRPGADLELQLASVFRSISAPVLSNIRVRLEGDARMVDLYPPQIPDLFLGRETLVAGTWTGAGKARLVIEGTAAGAPYSEEIPLDFPESTPASLDYVRAIWANRKVGYLLDEIRRNGESDELRDEVIALATEFNLVTPYTSFLAAPDAEYKGEGVAVGGRAGGDDSRLRSALPASASMDALNETAGASAVESSRFLNAQKAMDQAAAPSRPAERQKDTGRVVVNGNAFERNERAQWVQQNVTAKRTEVVQVKYLSPAYYQLLEQFPDRRPEILVAENVRLVINGQWVEVGETGIEDVLPTL